MWLLVADAKSRRAMLARDRRKEDVLEARQIR